jgi:hypothetical protein
MSFICEFCEAELSTKYTLKTHQTRTKSCLKIQKELGITIEHTNKFQCPNCHKEYTSKQNLSEHSCRISTAQTKEQITTLEHKLESKTEIMKELLNEKDETIKLLREMVSDAQEKLATKPTIVNNNIKNTQNNAINLINTPLVIYNGKEIREILDKNFTKKVYDNGFDGNVKFIVDNFFHDKDGNLFVVATDVNRGRFQHLTDDNQIATKFGSGFITKPIIQPLLCMNQKYKNEERAKIDNEKSFGDDKKATKKELKDEIHQLKKKIDKLFKISVKRDLTEKEDEEDDILRQKLKTKEEELTEYGNDDDDELEDPYKHIIAKMDDIEKIKNTYKLTQSIVKNLKEEQSTLKKPMVKSKKVIEKMGLSD